MLRDLGLALWIHHHAPQFQHGAVEMDMFLQTDPALVGLCVDVGHAAQPMAQATLHAWLRRHWERIGCLHYKDIDANAQLVSALGDGVIDFGAISRIALDQRSPGWIVAELDPGRGRTATRTSREAAQLSHDLVARTLAA